ncbi:MAG: nitrile hydratase subunit beta [Pseudomonadota bacterium]
MTRPHDMGGRFGDGPVVERPDEPVFPQEWHARVLAVTLAAGSLGQWNIDMSRHARERLCPKDYARFSYYEKWLAALTDLLVEKGIVTRDELSGAAPVPSLLAERALRADRVPRVLSAGGPADRSSDVAPLFRVGDAVVTRRIASNRLIDGGHTRLPNYAAGARGSVVRCHGAHVLPDSAAHGLGEAPEPLFAVAFPASELWAHPEHPRDEVVLDLWQSYLEPGE